MRSPPGNVKWPDSLPGDSVVQALEDSTQDAFRSFPPNLRPTKHPFRAPTAPAPSITIQMASDAPSLHSCLSPSAIAQVLEGYSATSVLLCSEVQRDPTFDLNEMHLWLGWADRRLMSSRGKTLFNSYAQLLQSTSVPMPMFFSLREISSITAHIDFRLMHMHNAPGISTMPLG
ncbi:hypothetical protein OBBRIDRAFT_832026 [Obba rivulosa]|uniref:Uncharacterized protein n=1 Tax=Obba rivulosa TaxID=1052685 RepID=A0A8E2DR21_9APHY|nr:hypothetical protein OBBRIDRAFT_832026 [Obba rivulosa]